MTTEADEDAERGNDQCDAAAEVECLMPARRVHNDLGEADRKEEYDHCDDPALEVVQAASRARPVCCVALPNWISRTKSS